MDRYVIHYDCEDESNLQETFEGSWFALQQYLDSMKQNGCYNIEATCITQESKKCMQEAISCCNTLEDLVDCVMECVYEDCGVEVANPKCYGTSYPKQLQFQFDMWADSSDVVPDVKNCIVRCLQSAGYFDDAPDDTKSIFCVHTDFDDPTHYNVIVQHFSANTVDRLTESAENQEKLVIYGAPGAYKVTPESNYNRQFADSRAITNCSDFESPEEIINYFCKYFKRSSQDFVNRVTESVTNAAAVQSLQNYRATNKYDAEQLYQLSLGLASDLDVSIYDDPEFTSSQMNEIYLGLRHGVNVSTFADPAISADEMHSIRKSLEAKTESRDIVNTKTIQKESQNMENLYNVSFKRNGVYQSNLFKANSEQAIQDWYWENKPDAEVIAIKVATPDDEKPGKPLIDIYEEPVTEETSTGWGPDNFTSFVAAVQERCSEDIQAELVNYDAESDTGSVEFYSGGEFLGEWPINFTEANNDPYIEALAYEVQSAIASNDGIHLYEGATPVAETKDDMQLIIGETVPNDGVALTELILDEVGQPAQDFKHVGNYVFTCVVGGKFYRIYTDPVGKDDENELIKVTDIAQLVADSKDSADAQKDTPIWDWYSKTFPKDYQLKDWKNKTVTFADLDKWDKEGKDFSELLGFDADTVIAERVYKMLDTLIPKTESVKTEATGTRREQLVAELKDKIHHVFVDEPIFGFDEEDADDWWNARSRVESDGRFVVEVRCELSYDGMWRLKEKIDPIVQKYDKDAYFDFEEPGIMSAYLNI